MVTVKQNVPKELILESVDKKMHKPNAKTLQVIRKAEKGKGLIQCKDLEDLVKKLDLD